MNMVFKTTVLTYSKSRSKIQAIIGMAEPSPSIDELAVAFLAARGYNQTEIAKMLGLSQPAVSRLMQRVKDDYLQLRFCEERLQPEQMARVQRRVMASRLASQLERIARENGHPCPAVHIVPVEDPQDVRSVFAARAAVVLKDMLSRVAPGESVESANVGVAWGNTLARVCHELRLLPPRTPWRVSPIRFVPLCGDPVIDEAQPHADRTASRIAADLNEIVNATSLRPPWLGLVPAFIPRPWDNLENPQIRGFCQGLPGYKKVFGNKAEGIVGLVENLDMIITAAGTDSFPLGGTSFLLDLLPEEATALTAGIYGDIGGVLLPKRPDHPSEGLSAQVIGDLTNRWQGMKIEHLENCARKAFETDYVNGNRPGVTLLSYRKDKREVILEGVKRGLLNHLIISSDLAKELEDATAVAAVAEMDAAADVSGAD
jgi:DNA-binding transcriptional regulator LsrR (DeoR family)